MRRLLVLTGVLLLAGGVAAGCGKFGSVYEGSGKGEKKSGKGISDKPFNAAARKAAGCTDIETIKITGKGEHTDEKVSYEVSPPTSGRHSGQPLDWGIYDTPQPAERMVHNQEHGHVLITYRQIPAAQIKQLAELVKRDPFHIVMFPRPKNDKKGVYFTSWKARQFCEKPSAPALQAFVDTYRDKGPELFMNDPKKKSEE